MRGSWGISRLGGASVWVLFGKFLVAWYITLYDSDVYGWGKIGSRQYNAQTACSSSLSQVQFAVSPVDQDRVGWSRSRHNRKTSRSHNGVVFRVHVTTGHPDDMESAPRLGTGVSFGSSCSGRSCPVFRGRFDRGSPHLGWFEVGKPKLARALMTGMPLTKTLMKTYLVEGPPAQLVGQRRGLAREVRILA